MRYDVDCSNINDIDVWISFLGYRGDASHWTVMMLRLRRVKRKFLTNRWNHPSQPVKSTPMNLAPEGHNVHRKQFHRQNHRRKVEHLPVLSVWDIGLCSSTFDKNFIFFNFPFSFVRRWIARPIQSELLTNCTKWIRFVGLWYRRWTSPLRKGEKKTCRQRKQNQFQRWHLRCNDRRGKQLHTETKRRCRHPVAQLFPRENFLFEQQHQFHRWDQAEAVRGGVRRCDYDRGGEFGLHCVEHSERDAGWVQRGSGETAVDIRM